MWPVCRQFIESAYDRAAEKCLHFARFSPEFCHAERPEWQNSTRRPRLVSVDDSLGGEATRESRSGTGNANNIEGVGALERGAARTVAGPWPITTNKAWLAGPLPW